MLATCIRPCKKPLFFNNKFIFTEISLTGMLYQANNMVCKTASFPFLSGLIFISQITINAQQRKDMKAYYVISFSLFIFIREIFHLKIESAPQQSDSHYLHDKCIILESGHPHSSRGISSTIFASASERRNSSGAQTMPYALSAASRRFFYVAPPYHQKTGKSL